MLPQNLNAGSSVASLKSRNAKFSVTRCLYEKAGLDPIVVQTRRSILASMSDFRQSVQCSAPEPEDVARVKTVLVVDDVESERIAIRTAIESRTKFRVCGEACNGIEAIRQANELRPDLVLMDLAMPLMNGLEAAKVLRNTMPTVPVVLLTLHADLIGPRSSVLGVTLVLSKNDGLAPLLRCVERLLGRKS
jgi:CheY-like chemotaxis protein